MESARWLGGGEAARQPGHDLVVQASGPDPGEIDGDDFDCNGSFSSKAGPSNRQLRDEKVRRQMRGLMPAGATRRFKEQLPAQRCAFAKVSASRYKNSGYLRQSKFTLLEQECDRHG